MNKKLLLLLLTSLYFVSFCFSCAKTEAYVYSKVESVTTNKEYYLIEIKGEINFPGLYKIEEGSTMNDLIMLAGGFTNSADTSSINLASLLSNNQLVVIPKITNDTTTSTLSLININTATKDDLCMLPGIGEAKAKNIISYRINNGYFKSIEEIKNVTGIGDELFAKIKDYICI